MKERILLLFCAMSVSGCSSSDYEPRRHQRRVIHHPVGDNSFNTTYEQSELREDAPPNPPDLGRTQYVHHQKIVSEEETAPDFRNDPDIQRIDALKNKIKALKGEIGTEDEEIEGMLGQYDEKRKLIINKTTERDERRRYLDKVDEELKQYYTR